MTSDSNQSGTRRESSASNSTEGGTRREAAGRSAGGPHDDGTRRESGAFATDGSTSYGNSQLLPSLQNSYRFIAELPSGNEAQVLHCFSQDAECDVLIKQYNKGIEPDTSALRSLQQVDLAHVIEIHAFDMDPSSSRFYEVLEWIPDGTLRDSITDDDVAGRLNLVIEELSTAIAGIHDSGVIHRDIKPENVLIRDRGELDLVVADFGIARALEGTKRMTTVAGTIEYRAPETIRSAVAVENRPGADWWSLGIIVAEIYLGRSFFALPDGSRRPVAAIEEDVRRARLDFDQIEDESVRLLCRGLCTHQPEDRWGAAQVSKWLIDPADLSLTVAAESFAQSGGYSATVVFNGEHDNPVDLSSALQDDWKKAERLLFDDTSQELIDQITLACATWDRRDVPEILSRAKLERDTTSGELLARLLIRLDSELRPIYDGVDVRPAALRRNPAGQSVESLQKISTQRILSIWRDLPGMEGAEALDRRWHEMEAAVINHGSSLWTSDIRDAERRRMLFAAINPAVATKGLRSRLKDSEHYHEARRSPEFARLVRRRASVADLALAAAVVDSVGVRVKSGSIAAVSGDRWWSHSGEQQGALAAMWVTLFGIAALGYYLRTEGRLPDIGLAQSTLRWPAAAAVGVAFVGMFLRRTLLIWFPLIATAGAVALVRNPFVWDSFFVTETSESQFAAAVLLAPSLGFFLAAGVTIMKFRGITFPALAAVCGLAFVATLDGPLNWLDQRSTIESAPASAPTTTALPTEVSGVTQLPAAEACFVAQLATFDTWDDAMEAANSGGFVAGPSEWIPGWSPGKWVVFAAFPSVEEAQLAVNAASGYQGVVVEIPAGGDACVG